MKKQELHDKTAAVINATQAALQLVYDSLNKGQQKKILRDTAVKTLFDRYGVQYSE